MNAPGDENTSEQNRRLMIGYDSSGNLGEHEVTSLD